MRIFQIRENKCREQRREEEYNKAKGNKGAREIKLEQSRDGKNRIKQRGVKEQGE